MNHTDAVYFGIVPPDKIETKLTAALALPGVEHQMRSHPDLEARARFTAMRGHLMSWPPDYRVVIDMAAPQIGTHSIGGGVFGGN